jgi:hypothetical protein
MASNCAILFGAERRTNRLSKANGRASSVVVECNKCRRTDTDLLLCDAYRPSFNKAAAAAELLGAAGAVTSRHCSGVSSRRRRHKASSGRMESFGSDNENILPDGVVVVISLAEKCFTVVGVQLLIGDLRATATSRPNPHALIDRDCWLAQSR